MKIPSLGNLTALAVLCAAPTVGAAVVFSTTVVDVPLSYTDGSSLNLDIDGDLTTDFTVHTEMISGKLGMYLFDENAENNVALVDTIDYFAKTFGPGETVTTGLEFSNYGLLYVQDNPSSPSNLGTFYVGTTFLASGSDLSIGWIKFSFPVSGNPTAVSAAYDTLENSGIMIPVPETSVYTTIGAVGLAAFAAWRRRSIK
ncbi:MAG TPA: hypothetical protein VMF06_02080 [Candidatus Limnocylindria bacterium]|jgi:hypothetical protein|nr:hypothetical protein [Candidatus Limnocylindria bacterium]